MADKDPALGWCEHHQVYHRNFVCEFGGGVDTDPPINYVRATERTERDALKAALDEAERALDDIRGGMGQASPSNAMLELGPGEFHKAFVPLLQKVAREALARIRERKEKADD